MKERTLLRINTLLEHIDEVLKDTEGVSIKELDINSVLLRATCFSIVQIGELMVQLEKDLGNKYPDLPWRASVAMRNLLVHDYGNVNTKIVHSTIELDLPKLKNDFTRIRNEIAQ